VRSHRAYALEARWLSGAEALASQHPLTVGSLVEKSLINQHRLARSVYRLLNNAFLCFGKANLDGEHVLDCDPAREHSISAEATARFEGYAAHEGLSRKCPSRLEWSFVLAEATIAIGWRRCRPCF